MLLETCAPTNVGRYKAPGFEKYLVSANPEPFIQHSEYTGRTNCIYELLTLAGRMNRCGRTLYFCQKHRGTFISFCKQSISCETISQFSSTLFIQQLLSSKFSPGVLKTQSLTPPKVKIDLTVRNIIKYK